jgi:hypothetical protein
LGVYRGPCRRCGLRRLEDGSGAFPQVRLPPHPQGEDGCVPGFWGEAADGPLFGTEGYWALPHIGQRPNAGYWEGWDQLPPSTDSAYPFPPVDIFFCSSSREMPSSHLLRFHHEPRAAAVFSSDLTLFDCDVRPDS